MKKEMQHEQTYKPLEVKNLYYIVNIRREKDMKSFSVKLE